MKPLYKGDLCWPFRSSLWSLLTAVLVPNLRWPYFEEPVGSNDLRWSCPSQVILWTFDSLCCWEFWGMMQIQPYPSYLYREPNQGGYTCTTKITENLIGRALWRSHNPASLGPSPTGDQISHSFVELSLENVREERSHYLLCNLITERKLAKSH